LLAVRDRGIGMSNDVKPRTLEPSFTTEETGMGTGLGPSIAYRRIGQTGESVRTDGAPAKGVAVAEAVPAEFPRGSVLVVEDNDGVRGFVSATLRAAGLCVKEAPDGQVALETLRRDGDVDLLLTDVGLPRMAGPDLALEAARLRPALRVAFISGYGGERLQGLVDSGAPLLPKPFSRGQLLEFVRRNLR
jgi:two-component system, cell cycle sensor histidine kinase and response regulator CckA